MVKISPSASLNEVQEAIQKIYGLPDDRLFSVSDLLSNQERFAMRALKGVRKGDKRKVKFNLIIAFCWLLAILNRFHINLEKAVCQRFPHRCSYCGKCPCTCKKIPRKRRAKISGGNLQKPATLTEFQQMFSKIYPVEQRTTEHAGIHLAEELGELSEAVHLFMGGHKEKHFKSIIKEAADYFSCTMGVANSANFEIAKEIARLFKNNCHVCHKAPCVCNFSFVAKFKS